MRDRGFEAGLFRVGMGPVAGMLLFGAIGAVLGVPVDELIFDPEPGLAEPFWVTTAAATGFGFVVGLVWGAVEGTRVDTEINSNRAKH